MPQRRTSSATSFLSSLHFSGKVIMASILFGFGLLLVGAILLIIATGGQSHPPLSDENSEEKKTPMTFVGPGVMGVGAFFVIVGTIMCLFETRILRRRKHTDHDSLINSEIVPTGNTEHRDRVIGEGDNNMEETEVKTVHADYHMKSSEAENAEKTPAKSCVLEKGGDKELTTSAEREQALAFNSSIYVDAVGENDYDDDDYDDEMQSVTESNQYSTPPESKPEAVLKAAFDGRPDLENERSKNLDTAPARTDISAEPITESSLAAPKESGSSLAVPKESGSSLAASKESGSSLAAPKESGSSLAAPKESGSSLAPLKESGSSLAAPKESGSSLAPLKESGSSLTAPKDNGSLLVPNENESALSVPKGNESSLLVPNETLLPVPNDLNTSRIPTETSVKATDLTEETLNSVRDPGIPVIKNKDYNMIDKERQEGSDQTASSDVSPDADSKEDSAGTDSVKATPPSAANTSTTGT